MKRTNFKRFLLFLGDGRTRFMTIALVMFFSLSQFQNLSAQLGPSSIPLLKSKQEVKAIIDQQVQVLADQIVQMGVTNKSDLRISALLSAHNIYMFMATNMERGNTMNDVAYLAYAQANFGRVSSNPNALNDIVPAGVSLSAWNVEFFNIIDVIKQ